MLDMPPALIFRNDFLEALSELHDAESQLLEVLPVLASSAFHPQLKAVFKNHLAQTRDQAKRIENILGDLGEPIRARASDAISFIISSARASIDRSEDPDTRDAWLIAAAQHIEHHAIAAYGRARTYARLLGLDRATEQLHASLHETALASVQLSDLSAGLHASRPAVAS